MGQFKSRKSFKLRKEPPPEFRKFRETNSVHLFFSVDLTCLICARSGTRGCRDVLMPDKKVEQVSDQARKKFCRHKPQHLQLQVKE